MQDNRPICATATAPGQGAIGVVRLSAPEPGVIDAIARAVCGARLADQALAAASGAVVAVSGGGADMGSDHLGCPAGTFSIASSSARFDADQVVIGAGDVGSDDRISGELSVEATTGRVLKPRHATYGPFLAEDAQPIDYGLALWFPAPHSYTGEHVLELQGHGGPVVQQILLRRVLAVGQVFGIRLAEPGEFTERAFLNDKLDLVQAEAVADLIEASTEQAARSATRSLQGVFSRQIERLADQLLHLRMLVEATLDFPEEEIEFLERADAAGQLDAIDATLHELFATARSGARLRQGLNVVLTGAPNVGKSSLLNALAGAEVAIVTPIAGTTRDRVIEQISIEGVPINLIDTAGLRETDDVVERIGIERTWAEIEKADVVVHLRAVQVPAPAAGGGTDPAHDRMPDSWAEEHAGQPSARAESLALTAVDERVADVSDSALIAAIDARVPPSTRRLTVINKIDLLGQGGVLSATPSSDVLHLSAKTGEGIEAFRQTLLDIAGFQPGAEGVFIARERHLEALKEALGHLDNARIHVAHGDQRLELFAEELRLAHSALGRITGAVSADELLGVIFSRFCIGK